MPQSFKVDSIMANKQQISRDSVIEEMRILAHRLWGGCHWCLGNLTLDKQHQTFRCRAAALKNPAWLKEKKVWKAGFKWQSDNTVCFFCWLPRHDAIFHQEGKCKFVDLLPESLWALWQSGNVPKAAQALSFVAQNPAQYREWLSRTQIALCPLNVWRLALWLFRIVDGEKTPG